MTAGMEMWAGVECTVSRVGDRYVDQLARSGHAAREGDVELLAGLGVAAVRYPVLWERTAPDGVAHADWRWSDRRLARLRALGVRPIVTLLHHGSGPRDTSLLDPRFPERLAEFARAAAERYPWVEEWTPINEPLTTARFSALYGHWYPHARDDRSFARAFMNQMRGVALAMREIRCVNPAARLVQTEDLGKTHASPSLAYQAAFENERRWLTFDALGGRLTPAAPMHRELVAWGIAPSELAALADAPCPPDVVGVNHYLTSERYLDRRHGRYPAALRGGNARHRYADVDAVRVLAAGPDGPRRLLAEAWARYERPLAVTEAHLGCTREQQMRWLAEVWEAATSLRATGADVRAVTAWSAFGTLDWSSLHTRESDHYESGLFDVRVANLDGARSAPRPTALAAMVRALATRAACDHPALDGPGWWRTPERLTYPPAGPAARGREDRTAPRATNGPRRPLLITGAGGRLGRALARACEARGLAFVAAQRDTLDIADAGAVDAALARWGAWAVVNAAGFARVDAAEVEAVACWRENVCGAQALADACAARGVRLVAFSTDLVFDGALDRPYVEPDRVSPLGAYGTSKATAEALTLARCPDALVVRTSALFGPHEESSAVARILGDLVAGRPASALDDVVLTPTYLPELADAVLDLLIDGERGVWHLTNDGPLTWAELARVVARRAGLDARLVRPVALADAGLAAARPRRSALASARGRLLGPVENAICHYLSARTAAVG